MDEYRDTHDGTPIGSESAESRPRRFLLKDRLGMTELWKRAKEHVMHITGAPKEPSLFDFGEERDMYYATVKDDNGNKYLFYCERK